MSETPVIIMTRVPIQLLLSTFQQVYPRIQVCEELTKISESILLLFFQTHVVATPAKMEEHANQAMEMLSPANVNLDSQETSVRPVSKRQTNIHVMKFFDMEESHFTSHLYCSPS